MTFWKRQNNGVRTMGGMNGWSTGDFQGSDMKMVALGHTFVRINRMYNTKYELLCKLWFYVVMMCQYRFMNCNKCTILFGDVDSGGRHINVRVMGYLLYFLLSFALTIVY